METATGLISFADPAALGGLLMAITTLIAGLGTAGKLMLDRQERHIAALATEVAACNAKHLECEKRATAAEVRIQFLEKTTVRKTMLKPQPEESDGGE